MRASRGRKLRPSTASGVIQSYEVSHILDDIRPSTAPGSKEPLPGLEPTYVTAQRPVTNGRTGGVLNKVKGRQVHGGVDKNDLKNVKVRRATIGPTENLAAFVSSKDSRRPITAGTKAGTLKVNIRSMPVVQLLVINSIARIQAIYLSCLRMYVR